MANYCKLCGADLPVETKTLTWEELVDWAKNLNAEIEGKYIEICGCFKVCGCFFWKDGEITDFLGDTIAENRSYEQMKTIIENLL